MKRLSTLVLASMFSGALFVAACVGDDPTGQASPNPDAGGDAAGPCTGAGCDDGGGQNPETDGGGGTPDGGGDAAPPACTKIQVTTLAGSVEGNMDGAGSVAKFKGPEGIVVDPATGTLFVADTGNKRIRKVIADGTTSTYSTTTSSGAWIGPRNARLPEGYLSLYVSDSGNDQVYAVDSTGTATSQFGFSGMSALAMEPTTFRMFVIGSNRVGKCTQGTFQPAEISGSFTPGFADGAGASARFDNPLDIGFDGVGFMYVADQGNHRIRKVNVTDGANLGDVTTVAGSATAGHVDGTGAAARFEGPNAFAIDPVSHLFYIADGATIRVMNTAGAVTTLVGSSSAYVDGDGCVAKFVNVKGITKFANELYVLDVNRIRKIVMN